MFSVFTIFLVKAKDPRGAAGSGLAVLLSIGAADWHLIDFVLAPLPHGIAHAEHLALKGGARCTNRQMQAQCQPLTPRKCSILPGNHQGGGFLTGSLKRYLHLI
jgi:hypothetical protein